jgi:asparagine synthase (glutamine-hydrolysing)
MFLGYAKYRSADQITNNHHDGTRHCLNNVLSSDMPSPDNIRPNRIDIPGISNVRLESLNDLFYSKVPRALRFNDHVSMQHSVELRIPFLRKQLLEFSLTLPDDFLMASDLGKIPVRRILSQETGNHSHAFAAKASVQSPQTEWFDLELSHFVEAAVLKSSLFDRGWVNQETVRNAMTKRISMKQNNSFFIWQLINLELMAQAFLD